MSGTPTRRKGTPVSAPTIDLDAAFAITTVEDVKPVPPAVLSAAIAKVNSLTEGQRIDIAASTFSALDFGPADLARALKRADAPARVVAQKDGSAKVYPARPRPAKPDVPAPGKPGEDKA